jgi:hypothetical protein
MRGGGNGGGGGEEEEGEEEEGEGGDEAEEDDDGYPEYEYEYPPPAIAKASRRSGGRGGGTSSAAPSTEPVENYVAQVLLAGHPNFSSSSFSTPLSTSTVSSRDDSYYSLQALKETLPGILVAGIGDVTRTVISREDGEGGKGKYNLVVAAAAGMSCLLDVMGIPGVKASSCISNDIINTSGVLGIEAARVCVSLFLSLFFFSLSLSRSLSPLGVAHSRTHAPYSSP